jgi:diguanylate cyclase (GGDEF)-like protein/hemerythrin-like metal-binding protein
MTVDSTDFAALRDLVARLPFPLVLFDGAASIDFANDRFADLFGREALDSPDLHRLADQPSAEWRPVKLRRGDGRDLAAYGQAVSVSDHGVLLVFDPAPGAVSMHETARLQKRILELENLSATDALTGAWNRAHLDRMVEMEISRTNRDGHPVTLILLDIDRFKRVNDIHGHLAGDEVLREFVSRIRKRVRDADTLFRWGGDEFVVLATSVGHRGAGVLGEHLRTIIASVPFPEAGPITASLGVAQYIEGQSVKRWFQRTDAALYSAKSAGGNCVRVDRQRGVDLPSSRGHPGVLRLFWLDAYECGEPTIDDGHRELFDRGNALIAAAIEQHAQPDRWRVELDATLAHLVRHFRDEEALLAEHGYPRVDEHRRSHAILLRRAEELKSAVAGGDATLGDLVNFLVNDVITLHLLKTDRDFFPLFQGEAADDAG